MSRIDDAMSRPTIVSLAAALALAACSPEVAPAGRSSVEPPQAPAAPVPTQVAAAPVSAAPPEPPPPPPVAPPDVVAVAMTELAPSQGPLLPLLKREAERAKAKGLKPYVEFYADWCPPCKTLAASMNDPAMMQAFKGIYVIKLNLDDWHDQAKSSGYQVKFIPSFFAIEKEGRQTGTPFVAATWTKRTTPAAMAGELGAFFKG